MVSEIGDRLHRSHLINFFTPLSKIMMISRYTRRGFSLLELLLAVAILAILLGLTLSAIQHARNTASLLRSQNNLRQIALALHQYNDERGKEGKLTQTQLPPRPFYTQQSIFFALLPYVYPERPATFDPSTMNHAEWILPLVPAYISPADPSINYKPSYSSVKDKISYAVNISAVDGYVNIPFGVSDGTSQTVVFSERYFVADHHGQWIQMHSIFPAEGKKPGLVPFGVRRATFADAASEDVVPVTASGQPTRASIPGMTFQYRPRVQDADGRMLHTPHPAGLPVALFDGSVRTLRRSIDESIFWSLVTPAAGDTVGEY